VKRDLPSWARRKLEVPPTDLVGWADWVTKITHDHARETRRRGGLDPLLFVHNAAGLVGIMFGLGPYLDDEEGKEKLGTELIPEFVRSWEATRFAWVTEAWGAKGSPEYEAWRKEQIAAGNLSLEGGPGVVEVAFAVLGEWTGSICTRQAPLTRGRDRKGYFYEVGEFVNPYEHLGRDVATWPNGYNGRLIDDAMRVMMGHPTGMEVRKAIVVMSSPGAETRELMDKAFRLVAEREGLDADVVRGIMGDVEGVATPEELERLLLLTAKELVQDEAFRVVMEREFEEHAGPIGPIRGGGQSGFSL
jgi:hypothetical protein